MRSCRGRTRPRRTSRGGARRRGRTGLWTSRGGAARAAEMPRAARVLADRRRCAGPRGRGDARGCGVAVAASPRFAPPGEISRASSLFPSLPSLSSSFLVSLGRLSQQTTFAARYRAQSLPSLGFPPARHARSISRAYQGWRPPHPPWRPEDD